MVKSVLSDLDMRWRSDRLDPLHRLGIEVDLTGAGDDDRFHQADEFITGRRAVHPHPRVDAVAEDDDRRRLVDFVFGLVFGIEHEVLLDDRHVVVE